MTLVEHYNNMVNTVGSSVVNTAPRRIAQSSDAIQPINITSDQLNTTWATVPTTLGYNTVNTVATGVDTMTRAEIQAMFNAVMQGNRSVATDRAYNPAIGYDGGHQNPSIVKLAFGEKSKQEDNHQTISNKRKLDL